MNVVDGILFCKIACTNTKMADITGKENTEWLDAAIDLKQIYTIKDTGGYEEDTEIENKASLYIVDGYFISEMDFKTATDLWLKHRKEKQG